jgi:hypothetical protein
MTTGTPFAFSTPGSWHVDVAQDQIDCAVFEHAQSFGSIARLKYVAEINTGLPE